MAAERKVYGAADVRKLLEEDTKNRRYAEAGRVVTEITTTDMPKGHWDGSLPTFVGPWTLGHSSPEGTTSAWKVSNSKLQDARSAWRELTKIHPLLKLGHFQNRKAVLGGVVDLDPPKFIIAGGAVYSAAAGLIPADVDVFYVGNAAKATEALESFLKAIHRHAAALALAARLKDLAVVVDRQYRTKTTPELFGIMGLDVEAAVAELMAGWDGEKTLEDHLCGLPPVHGLTFEKGSSGEALVAPPPGVPAAPWYKKVSGVMFPDEQLLEAPIAAIRTKNAVTVKITNKHFQDGPVCGEDGLTIQIILRAYAHRTHVLEGFDLGASAIRFNFENGEPRYSFSPLGHFAYATGANVVDPSRVSPSFVWRLRKYSDRGFKFILPQFDSSKVPRENLRFGRGQMINLPGLTFSAQSVNEETFTGEIHPWGVSPDIGGGRETSDYTIEDVDSYVAAGQNLRTLSEGGDNFICMTSDGDKPWAILSSPPYLDYGDMFRFYDSLPSKIWTGAVFNEVVFNRFVAPVPPVPADAPMWAGRATPPDLPSMEVAEFFAIPAEDRLESLCHLLAGRRAAIIQLWQDVLKGPHTVAWMTEHPCSQERAYQFTGSMKPLFVSPEDWYGDYLKTTAAPLAAPAAAPPAELAAELAAPPGAAAELKKQAAELTELAAQVPAAPAALHRRAVEIAKQAVELANLAINASKVAPGSAEMGHLASRYTEMKADWVRLEADENVGGADA